MIKLLTLSIILFIVSMSAIGQEIYLKKVSIQNFEQNSFYISEYIYDTDWKLDSIKSTNEDGYPLSLKDFSNDTLLLEVQPNLTIRYEHYVDSVMVFYENGSSNLQSVYYLNIDFEATSQRKFNTGGGYTGTNYFSWEDGNLMDVSFYNGNIWTFDYFTEYKNPYENENKYMKRSLYASGSYASDADFTDYIWKFQVLSHINGYPVEVELYKDGELNRNILFEYHNVTNVEVLAANLEYEVLDIMYYNISGQKINKPDKGFYIERKHTDKGMFSKKYFIQ